MSAITAKRLSDNKVFHGPRMLDRRRQYLCQACSVLCEEGRFVFAQGCVSQEAESLTSHSLEEAELWMFAL